MARQVMGSKSDESQKIAGSQNVMMSTPPVSRESSAPPQLNPPSPRDNGTGTYSQPTNPERISPPSHGGPGSLSQANLPSYSPPPSAGYANPAVAAIDERKVSNHSPNNQLSTGEKFY